ncbi:cell surface glycoprotein CD200 receptor 2 [Microtus ochrogaster]|uniref:Cell surface glycoprotein CD200 receptor 2 n=1 Tax=Microtus ochrogaster TaxID=79684 RepID=A0ABM1AS74_MICOH|nr:cell surface glycoprotein CD200 receptor 2 [Microtus ochrogaster]
MNSVGRTSALRLLIFFTILVPDGNVDSSMSTTLFVQKGAKALLCCPALPKTETVLIIWVIAPRGQPPCRIIYRAETMETNETNCTDKRLTWVFTPDQSPVLQINAVTLDLEGLYSCEIATAKGNFLRRHDLQVLVPPAVTLLPGENRTAVCEAIAGKPAAQIFWTPDEETIIELTCPLPLPAVTGVTSTLHSLLTILYLKLSLLGIILLIVGFAFFQKRNYFR